MHILILFFFRTWSVTANQAPYLKIVELVIKLIKFLSLMNPVQKAVLGS